MISALASAVMVLLDYINLGLFGGVVSNFAVMPVSVRVVRSPVVVCAYLHGFFLVLLSNVISLNYEGSIDKYYNRKPASECHYNWSRVRDARS